MRVIKLVRARVEPMPLDRQTGDRINYRDCSACRVCIHCVHRTRQDKYHEWTGLFCRKFAFDIKNGFKVCDYFQYGGPLNER